MSDTSHPHVLISYLPGESKVEHLARKIEDRINERVAVTFHARKAFLMTCEKIAQNKHNEKMPCIKYSDLLEFRAEVKEENDDKNAEGIFSRCVHAMGVLNNKQCLANILDQAEEVATSIELGENDWFHYQDFNFFHTHLVSRWPWMRHHLLFAFSLVFCWYFFTPVLFCAIMNDQHVCPGTSGLEGWATALYFASATLGTVGKFLGYLVYFQIAFRLKMLIF